MEYEFLKAAIDKWYKEKNKKVTKPEITPYSLLKILEISEQLEKESHEKEEEERQKVYDETLGDLH